MVQSEKACVKSLCNAFKYGIPVFPHKKNILPSDKGINFIFKNLLKISGIFDSRHDGRKGVMAASHDGTKGTFHNKI